MHWATSSYLLVLLFPYRSACFFYIYAMQSFTLPNDVRRISWNVACLIKHTCSWRDKLIMFWVCFFRLCNKYLLYEEDQRASVCVVCVYLNLFFHVRRYCDTIISAAACILPHTQRHYIKFTQNAIHLKCL